MERIPSQGTGARRLLTALLTWVAVLAALPALASAATTFNVNTEADTTGGGCAGVAGDCSIRSALDLAQDGDTVAIPAGHYTLDPQNGVLPVNTSIAIQGTGNPVIDGGDATGVFLIQPGPTVAADGITVTGGNDTNNGGGGFAVYGDLTLTNSTVSGNKATWSGGGIGILRTEAPPGSVRLVNSTVSGNKAGRDGGGISNQGGTLTIVQSTIVDNHAGEAGDGFDHYGGGVHSDTSYSPSPGVFIFSSTITGNSAAGDAGAGGNVYIADPVVISFVVASAVGVVSGGPAPAPGTGTLQNTIVAGGSASTGADCGGVAPVSFGYNAVPSGQCGSGVGDVSGDPKLGTLANNGGQTQTRKLLPGSAAIDTGDVTGCKDDNDNAITPDQRTQPRPVDGRCDIGAVEFAPPKANTTDPANVTTSSATINGTATNPLIFAGTAHFEFGTSTDYGTNIDVGSVASGASNDPRNAGVTGLSPNTTYHYRLVVSNDDDTAFGPDVEFRTGTPIPQPDPQPQPQPEPSPNPKPRPKPKRPTIRAARAGAGCVRTRYSARLSIHVSSSTKLRSVRVTLDGKLVRKTTRKRFSVHINARHLRAGTHVVRVAATDSGGRRTTIRRIFRRCRPPAQPAFTG